MNDPRNLARGLPFDLISPFAMQTAEIAEKIFKNTLEAGVRGACMFAGEADNETIANCVTYRCGQAQSLVARYLERARKRQ